MPAGNARSSTAGYRYRKGSRGNSPSLKDFVGAELSLLALLSYFLQDLHPTKLKSDTERQLRLEKIILQLVKVLAHVHAIDQRVMYFNR